MSLLSELTDFEEDGGTDENYEFISMKLQKEAVQKVEELVRVTNAPNKTQIVANSVGVFYWIAQSISQGGRIYVEYPDGTKQELQIFGNQNP